MNDLKPLDWTALVLEARRRRATDKLTQIEHANLAGVSRTTIRSFDNFERTITVEKAEAILKVVGLLADERASGAGEDFVADSWAQWLRLSESLPAGDPARLEHGHYQISYELLGELSPKLTTSSDEWLKILSRIPKVSGWSPFRISAKPAFKPNAINNSIECWLGKPEIRDEKFYTDAPHLDYWRMSLSGIFFTLRGYREDGADSARPGEFLDVGLPLWRAGDVIEHARLVCKELSERKIGNVSAVRFSARWGGLSSRVLVDWSNPTAGYTHGGRYRSRIESVQSSAEVDTAQLSVDADQVLSALIKPLYQAFDFKNQVAVDELITERTDKLKREGWAGRGV